MDLIHSILSCQRLVAAEQSEDGKLGSKQQANINCHTGATTPVSRSKKIATLFTCIPASSAGMTIVALLLSLPAHATGVCLVCPPGFDCTSDSPVVSGTAGQVLIREGTSTAWKSVADVALQGNRGAQGATGATGPRGPQGATGSDATWVYDHTKIYGVMGGVF